MTPSFDLNYEIYRAINDWTTISPILNAIMAFFADRLIFAFFPLILLLWGIPLSWRKNSVTSEYAQIDAEKRAVAIWTVASFVIAIATNILISKIVFEPRPFVSHQVHLIVAHAADSSFPSDHTAASFSVAGMLGINLFAFYPVMRSTTMRYRRTLKWFFLASLIMACLIGFSRIFVGVHYPGDILGGILTGLLASFIATLLRVWLQKPTRSIITLLSRLRLA